jgi:cytochrome P450
VIVHLWKDVDRSAGRFFAINEMKLMLAFTLLRYDIKTDDGRRPPDLHISYVTLPNTKAEVLFKRRS